MKNVKPAPIRTVLLVMGNLLGFLIASTVATVLALTGHDGVLAIVVALVCLWGLLCTLWADW
jgi:hypothetical protein